MEITGEHRIPASPEEVWKGLNDPDVLCRCIPGCKSLERSGDNEFTATVAARVGPVSATFKGKVELSDLDPPHGYTLSGHGQGGAAGFARGRARVTLEPEENGAATRLGYAAEAEVGGKLASVGNRLVHGVARKTADDFFSAFSRAMSGETPAGTRAEAIPETEGQVGPAGSAAAGTGQAPGSRHIPLVDRLAWLLVGFALGVAATLVIV